MKVLPVQSQYYSSATNFKGYYKMICKNTYGPDYSLTTPNMPYTVISTQNHPQEVIEAIKRNSPPYSEMQQTLGGFHDYQTFHVYFADPKEEVGDNIRKIVDFVVYDKEPKYPHPDEISTSYFGNDNNQYSKRFEAIRDYYYRLEMADRKTLAEYEENKHPELSTQQLQEKIGYYRSRITESQYQQWQAQECLNKYSASNNLRTEKEGLERHIKYLSEEIEKLPKSFEYCSGEYQKRLVEIEKNNRLNNLFTQNIENYRQILFNNARLKNHDKEVDLRYDDDKKRIKSKISSLERSRTEIQNRLKKLIEDMNHYKNVIENYPQAMKDLPDELKKCKARLAQVKAELIPLFDDLKLFYAVKKIIR